MGLKRDILIGLAVAAVVVLILAVAVGIVILLAKMLALLLVLAGIFLIAFFPDIGDFMPIGMAKTGIILGIILLVIGIWLIVA